MSKDKPHRSKIIKNDRDTKGNTSSKHRINTEQLGKRHEQAVIDKEGKNANKAKLEYLLN